jgi:hypothetical protein
MTGKGIWFLLLSASLLASLTIYSSVYAQGKSLESQLLTYAGKHYAGTQDPEYVSYNQTLRDVMVKKISKQFGVDLDPQKFSGFDLLEIESHLRFKKASEPADMFLKPYPKYQ